MYILVFQQTSNVILMHKVIFTSQSVRKSIPLSKTKTTSILILSHLFLSVFPYSSLFIHSNDYEDCHIDVFSHGHICTTRSFSPLQRHPTSVGWLQFDEDFRRYEPLIYCSRYFHKVKNHRSPSV